MQSTPAVPDCQLVVEVDQMAGEGLECAIDFVESELLAENEKSARQHGVECDVLGIVSAAEKELLAVLVALLTHDVFLKIIDLAQTGRVVDIGLSRCTDRCCTRVHRIQQMSSIFA